jgi:ribonuclease Z
LDAFDVTILGCSSALPAFGRYPSSQLVHIAGRYFLIDCGEGTQMQLRRFSLKFQRIDHIFISHLHGDHYLGLPGLMASMHLLGRTEPLELYADEGLNEILQINNRHSHTVLKYPVHFHSLDFSESKLVFEDEKVKISTLILKHSIQCCGFVFEEKQRPRKLIKEKIEELRIPIASLEALKSGDDYTAPDGVVIPNIELTTDPLPPRKYAYCSDTIYNKDLLAQLQNADLIYHESTFMEDMRTRADQTMHSTAKDAANMAKEAGAKRLLLGHFSARYKDLNPLLEEARSVFPQSYLAQEGEKYFV